MAAENHEGDMSEISSLTDSSDEGKKVVEEVVEAVEEIDKPAYSEEDLETLVGFIRGMIILFDYEDEDFNDDVAETIKLWLTDANNPLLFIFYDGNRLSASLAFPLCPINDLMYFMREQDQLFNVLEQFHDDILFGTLHGDIEGSLLVLLEQVYGPMILSNVDWSESVKANVINGFNAFMTYLSELHYKLSGFTLLYVPREGSDMEVQEVVLNRSMIKRLEAVVIDWTAQIRATLSDTQHFVPDDLVCPSDEYSFWLYRHEVLSAIRLQYNGPNVQHIVRILELAQSLYIKHMRDVLRDLDKEIEIAESNIPFLKLLVDPCFAIGTLETADDFCSQLIYVMHIIRFIGQDSSYLNKDESMTKLFLYLSNEIVACCMRGIDVDRILAGAPRYGIEICKMKISCCESYKIIYEEMLEHFKSEFTWNLDYAAIFNRINAFLQRLHDILEVCDAMLIFGKYAEGTSYTSYRFFCNNAAEYERRCDQVEKIFHGALATIESVGGTILDINNKHWYRYIGEFRDTLKSLDDIIENLLSNVFLMSENLEEKLNVLVTLLNFYQRESVRESFMRKIGEVWSIFNNEIIQLSKDISAGITDYPALLPSHAGRYAVLKMRFEHLTHLRKLIVNCRFFPEYPKQEEVLALFEACEKQVKFALKGFNESWSKSIPSDMASWYQRNLICRSNVRPGLFEVNIERRLLLLFDEAHYFKILGAPVPMGLDLEKHENTLLTFDNVLRLVLYFNGVISSISDKERLFFKPMIQQTERKLEPLRSKLTWEEDLSEFIDGYVVNVRELLELIELYKRENQKIVDLVERIYGMVFVRLDLGQHPVSMAQLIDGMTEQKQTVLTELVEVMHEISTKIFTVRDSIGSNLRKMSSSWEHYVRKIDKLLTAAIFTCTFNTLRGVHSALENANSNPILLIEILLKPEGTVYEPPVEAVEQTLRRLTDEVCMTIKPVNSMAKYNELDDCERSFYVELLEHSEYHQICGKIDETIDETVRLLRTYQAKWNVFRPFWCVDKVAFIERFKLSAMTSEAFQTNIEKFEELQNQLSTQGELIVCRCVEIDALKLKYALTSHIAEWQTKYIDYLKCIAYGKIIDFNNVLKSNVEELRHEPKEVYELKRLEERYQACYEELPTKEQEIGIILKYFVVLEKYVADLLPEAYELRHNIDRIWAQYRADLREIREQIDNYQDQFKLSMTGAADALKVDALEMLKMLRDELPTTEESSPGEAFKAIDRLMMQLEVLERREREIEEKFSVLGVSYHPLSAIQEIRSKLEHLKMVWVFVEEWRMFIGQIMDQNYRTVDEIELHTLSNHFKQMCTSLEEGPVAEEGFDVFLRTAYTIAQFYVTAAIVCTMKNSFLQQRHWQKVKDIIKAPEGSEELSSGCSLRVLSDLQVYCFEEKLNVLCDAARKEHELELEIERVTLQVCPFAIMIRKTTVLGADFPVLANHRHLYVVLGENIAIIDRLRRSPHRHPFQARIDYWEQTLGLLQEILDGLVELQAECRTLFEFQRLNDPRSASCSELDRFNDDFSACFAIWCEQMRYISSARLVEDVCPAGREFLEELGVIRRSINQQMEQLKTFLAACRDKFPRFYLLSDWQLVSFLAQPFDRQRLQRTLAIIYENVVGLSGGSGSLESMKSAGIESVCTRDGECIPFTVPLKAHEETSTPLGTVGIMVQLDRSIRDALQDLLPKCHSALRAGYFKRVESGWLRSWPLQLCLKSCELKITQNTKSALAQCSLLGRKKPLKMLRSLHTKMLEQLTACARRGADVCEGADQRWQRKKLNDLLIVELNARDLIERLYLKPELHGVQSIEWISQLHSYLDQTTSKCFVQLLDTHLSYGYECKRSTEPALLTATSEKARIATLCAMKAKQIPLLVGKTEANYGRHAFLDSLAHSLGVFLRKVSCGRQDQTEDVTRLITGMRKLGGWLALLDFERISSSVVVRQIGDCVRRKLGTHRKLVTTNDAAQTRYIASKFQFVTVASVLPLESRNELLGQIDRTLYRPVHFSSADSWKVLECWLWLTGFEHCTRLANLIKLFISQMKLQDVDSSREGAFSLRILKRVIEGINFPDSKAISHDWEDEKHTFIEALLIAYEGYLSDMEMNICRVQLKNVFGDYAIPDSSDADENGPANLAQQMAHSLGYELSAGMLGKVLCIHRSLLSNRPLIVCGDPGTGKSVAIHVALKLLDPSCETHRLVPSVLRKLTDPKSFDRTQFDGIVSEALRKGLDPVSTSVRKCLILDSVPSDEWIMGAVQLTRHAQYVCRDFTQLDVANGDGPQETASPTQNGFHVKVIVECSSPLDTMTPSAVSHFALVHIGPGDLRWRELIEVWLKSMQHNDAFASAWIGELTEKHFDQLLAFRERECPTVATVSDVALARTFIQLFNSLLSSFDSSKMERNLVEEILRKLFFFCCVWSIGGSLEEEDSRGKYDLLVREHHPEAAYPLKGTVFQYHVDLSEGVWRSWETLLIPSANNRRLFVETTETVANEFVIRHLMKDGAPVLVGSESVAGKTSLIENILFTHDHSRWASLRIVLTKGTTVDQIRGRLQCQTLRIMKHRLYPKDRKRMVCFFDDLHTASSNPYAVQEFVRNFCETSGWYEGTTSVSLQQCQMVAAMRFHRCDGSVRSVMQSLLNKCHVLMLTAPTDDELGQIFSTSIAFALEGTANDGLPKASPVFQLLALATVNFIARLTRWLPPTPARPRYQFSLHTIASIVRSVCCVLAEDTDGIYRTDKPTILRLWIHECFRETWDRLDRAHHKRFNERFNETISEYFEVTLHGLCPNLCPLYGDLFPVPADAIERPTADGKNPYVDIRDTSKLVELAEGKLMSPSPSTPPAFIIHREAVEQAVKLLRCVRLKRVGMMLVGRPGGGRSVVCELAARLSPTPTTFHRINKADLDEPGQMQQQFLTLFRKCLTLRTLAMINLDDLVDGGQPNERLLELLNRIVLQEDLDVLFCDNLAPLSKQSTEGWRASSPSIDWVKVQANLHLILCVPTDGATYRMFSQRYPSLLVALTVNCVHDWPQATLLEISKKYLLKNVPLNVPIRVAANGATSLAAESSKQKTRTRESLVQSTEERLQIATHDLLFRIHYAAQTEVTFLIAGKRNIIAPCSWYFELLHTFERVLREKRLQMQTLHQKFRVGIERILDATAKVASLSEELEERQGEIGLFQEQLNEFLEQISLQKQEAAIQTEEVSVKRVKIGAEEIVCKQLADVAEADLQRAMPALNAAVSALDSLNKKDMNEIKSYSRPPTKVELVMEAVMILLGKEPSWAESKRQLGEQKFLETLKSFDRNNIAERTLKTISGYVRNPELEPEKVGTVSKAAKSLMLWVRAIDNYGKVYKYVGPKIRKMEEANASLLEKQNELIAAERKLLELAERLAHLQAEYEMKIEEKRKLEEVAREMALKLERARSLVNNLASERVRWTATKDGLEADYARLIGDTLLASGCLTYYGPLDIASRTVLLDQWIVDFRTMEMPFTGQFSLTAFFYQPEVLVGWRENGLPPDDFSGENAAILLNSTRAPLIVDPQEEAQKWLLAEFDDARVVLVDFEDEISEETVVQTFQQHVPFVVENINRRNVADLDELFVLQHSSTVSCSLCNAMEQSSVKRHAVHVVTREPLLLPEHLLKSLNPLSFVLGAEGLEMKMLALLVEHENPSLEERKAELQRTILKNKQTLTELEERILRILNESTIPLLEDEDLYEVLQTSRATDEIVSGELKQAEVAREEIETARDVYQSCAERSALLFLVLGDLQQFNPLYSYSLEWYKTLFLQSLDRSGRVQVINERKRRIDDYHTFNVFRSVCRGLFGSDRKLFAFYLCTRLLFASESLNPREFRFLVFGAGKIDRNEQMENPCTGWLVEGSWDQLTDLDRLPGFHGIIESFYELPDAWKRWYRSPVPEEMPLPGSWEANLKRFQKYLIVRCLRQDRIESCMTEFTKDTLGARYINQPTVSSLEDVLQESSAQTLVLLLIRDNSNPLPRVQRLGQKVRMLAGGVGGSMKQLNMTDDRLELFIEMLAKCVADQSWLYVGDCHLSERFLRKLPQVVVFLRTIEPQSHFRLWLACQPHEAFPVSVLQSCIKLAYEEPKGIKHTMSNLYDELGETKFQSSTASLKEGGPPGSVVGGGTTFQTHYKRLLFTVSFLHGLLQERSNFQQLGWIEPYHFVNSDFSLAERLLAYGLNKAALKKVNIPRKPRATKVKGDGSGGSADAEDEMQDLALAEDEQEHDPTPWQFIREVLLEICYGTQFVCGWDRRVYEEYVGELFQSQLLLSPVASQNPLLPAGWFRMPRDGSYQTYVDFIGSQLPDSDGIDVFGQHENANIKYLKSRSDYMLQMLSRVAKDLDPGHREHHQKQQQQQQRRQHHPHHRQHLELTHEHTKQTVSDLLSTLPVYLDYENALRIVGSGSHRTPVTESLLAEVRTYNGLLSRVQSECNCLLRMLSGVTVLDEPSGKWSTLLDCLAGNRLPVGWRWRHGDGMAVANQQQPALMDWIADFSDRVRYFRRWTETGQLPAELVLGRFADPKRFLGAVLQHVANQHQSSVEDWEWQFSVFSTPKPLERISIDQGLIASGLTLENSGWDWENRSLLAPDILEMTCPMPPIAFLPKRKSVKNEDEANVHYKCPVFYDAHRGDASFVVDMQLAVDEDALEQGGTQWVKYNTALLLNH